MKDVVVRQSYVNDLRAGLPIAYLEFWFAQQEIIDRRAHEAFAGERPDNVDPEHDVVEIRGHWEAGNCDYSSPPNSYPIDLAAFMPNVESVVALDPVVDLDTGEQRRDRNGVLRWKLTVLYNDPTAYKRELVEIGFASPLPWSRGRATS